MTESLPIDQCISLVSGVAYSARFEFEFLTRGPNFRPLPIY